MSAIGVPSNLLSTHANLALGGAMYGLARRFWYSMRRCWWSAYFRIEVSGLEHLPASGPMLLCANHSSHLDAAAILDALPRDLALRTATAAAKDVFGDHPWRNAVSELTTGSVAIQRQAGFAKGLRVLEQVLLSGRPLVLFPEGRRSRSGELLPLKAGAAMLAIRTETPIVPIRLKGVNKALPKGSALPKASDVTVRFGAPIDPVPYVRAIASGQMTRRQAYVAMTEALRSAIGRMAVEPREALLN